MGAGGFGHWKIGQPSDCSGWLSWLMETQRAPKPGRDSWIETSAMVRDAKHKQQVFTPCEPQPGCFIAYPDSGGHQGHCGLITAYDETTKHIKGIDCSHGSWTHFQDAIREHDLTGVFDRDDAITFCLKQDL
jgi:hypothetical protein